MHHVISSDLGVEEASDGYFLVVKTPNPDACATSSLLTSVSRMKAVPLPVFLFASSCAAAHTPPHTPPRAPPHITSHTSHARPAREGGERAHDRVEPATARPQLTRAKRRRAAAPRAGGLGRREATNRQPRRCRTAPSAARTDGSRGLEDSRRSPPRAWTARSRP